MATRVAACACGRLTATVLGEPLRVSICHCLECQRRGGGVFGAHMTVESLNDGPVTLLVEA